MEEFKNGAISEEALEEIAGGLKMPKITLKKVLIGAGVAILAAGGAAAGGGIAYASYKAGQKSGKKSGFKEGAEYGHTETINSLKSDFPFYGKGEPKNDPSKSFSITDMK